MSAEKPRARRSRGSTASGSGSSGSGVSGSADRPGGRDEGPATQPLGSGASGTADQAAQPAADGAADQTADEELRGPELARATVEAALESSRARRAATPPRRRSAAGSGERRLRGYSGPGPDPRDPQPLGAVLDRLVKARGWQKPAAEATVFGSWEKVVGADIASHCRPVKLEGGELTVEAESTAWATQLRLLAGKVLASIAAEVGGSVVRKLRIHGPAAPSWARGPRRVRGRGPRDTYG